MTDTIDSVLCPVCNGWWAESDRPGFDYSAVFFCLCDEAGWCEACERRCGGRCHQRTPQP